MKFLTESDVRGAVEQSLETTARGEGDDERQILNYEYLTRVLNDLAEQNVGEIYEGREYEQETAAEESGRFGKFGRDD